MNVFIFFSHLEMELGDLSETVIIYPLYIILFGDASG